MYNLLQGMTVVEGAAFIAGPSCGLYLAQMGATVIRFDQIGGGPDSRRWPITENGESLYWEGLNKSKKSIALDLTSPAGRHLAQRLATAGDGLFVTNFPENGFLSYDPLSRLRPDLICLRVMGWADGTPAVDYTVNAAVGVPMMTGRAEDPRPVNNVLPAWDLLAGAYGAFALLAAERDRRLSRLGREVRLALADVAASTLGNLGSVAETLASGDRSKFGNDLFGAFGRDFPTMDGQRVMIVAITSRQWSGLLNALEIGPSVTELEAKLGVSFEHEGERFIHREQLFPIVERATVRSTMHELGTAFEKCGVCWAVYRTLGNALECEPRLFSENPIFSAIKHVSGVYPAPGAMARLPREERLAPRPAPRIGQDTDEILTVLLGLGSGEVARLRDARIVA